MHNWNIKSRKERNERERERENWTLAEEKKVREREHRSFFLSLSVPVDEILIEPRWTTMHVKVIVPSSSV